MDPTESNPPKTEKSRPNPTDGSTQTMDNSAQSHSHSVYVCYASEEPTRYPEQKLEVFAYQRDALRGNGDAAISRCHSRHAGLDARSSRRATLHASPR